MNVCSPIALNAISSENELIVYIEMMRTGGQTKTGTKRKRRKKRSGISIRWDRKESKIDECRSNQCACTRTWAQQNRKKRPSTSLEMIFGGKKNTIKSVCMYSLKMRTLSNWNGHFSSIPIDTISDMNYLHYFSMSQAQKMFRFS